MKTLYLFWNAIWRGALTGFLRALQIGVVYWFVATLLIVLIDAVRPPPPFPFIKEGDPFLFWVVGIIMLTIFVSLNLILGIITGLSSGVFIRMSIFPLKKKSGLLIDKLPNALYGFLAGFVLERLDFCSFADLSGMILLTGYFCLHISLFQFS